MREYAIKKQPGSVQPELRNKTPEAGMSNQALLSYLSASQKHRVPNEDGIRQRLTEKFDVNFSGLKITKDAALNDIQERAYTKGNEIHLAPDVNPDSSEGQQILMHEATHVIQQGTRSLSGGMLHDSSMEAQANDIARGAVHIDTSGFTMPEAAGAPVQGFLDFIFNRKRYNQNKAQKLIQQSEGNDPGFARTMGKILDRQGLGGTAIFDPERHAQLFGQSPLTQDGIFRRPDWPQDQQVTAQRLQRELVGLPSERLATGSNALKLHGVSQEDLDAMSRVDTEGYRRMITKSNRGVNKVANMDWTRMSDSQFLKNYPMLKAISRLGVVACQASGVVDADRELERDTGRNRDLMAEHQESMDLINPLMTYAENRLRGIAGSRGHTGAAESFAEPVRGLQQRLIDNHAARTNATPRQDGFFTRLFKRLFGRR